jgi:ribonuclease D
MITDYQWIDDDSDLEQLQLSIMPSDIVAFVSEFDRIISFYQKPALFQLKVNQSLYLIDMKEITDDKIFTSLLNNIILHSGSEDLEILFNLTGKLPDTLFDTQIAASLCGYGTHFSYQNIVKELLQIELPKAHSRSDWMKRPLSDEQKQYALEDVIYLHELKNILEEQIAQKHRLEWFKLLIDQRKLAILNSNHPEKTFQKMISVKNFNEQQQKLLYSLLIWRENQAIARNKPRGWILKNNQIIDISIMQPKTENQLIKDIDLYRGFVKHNADAIFELYETSKQVDLEPLPNRNKLSASQGLKLNQLKQQLAKKCEELNLPSALIANVAELKNLAAKDKDLNQIKLWQLINQ